MQATEGPDELDEPEPEAELAAAGYAEAEEEQEEEEADARPPNALGFNEPLSWKAGKAIPIATLIKRLTRLSKELSELDQEGVDIDSLVTPAKELATVGLMQHKDPGVKAFTACCLADMLRLHAPDAPYTAFDLKVCMCVFCPVCFFMYSLILGGRPGEVRRGWKRLKKIKKLSHSINWGKYNSNNFLPLGHL